MRIYVVYTRVFGLPDGRDVFRGYMCIRTTLPIHVEHAAYCQVAKKSQTKRELITNGALYWLMLLWHIAKTMLRKWRGYIVEKVRVEMLEIFIFFYLFAHWVI